MIDKTERPKKLLPGNPNNDSLAQNNYFKPKSHLPKFFDNPWNQTGISVMPV